MGALFRMGFIPVKIVYEKITFCLSAKTYTYALYRKRSITLSLEVCLMSNCCVSLMESNHIKSLVFSSSNLILKQPF